MATTNSQIELAWYEMCELNAWSFLQKEPLNYQWLRFLWLASQDARQDRQDMCFFESLWQSAIDVLQKRTQKSSTGPNFLRGS